MQIRIHSLHTLPPLHPLQLSFPPLVPLLNIFLHHSLPSLPLPILNPVSPIRNPISHNRRPQPNHFLKFVPPQEPGVVHIPDHMMDDENDEWNHTLIGCFAGRYPGFQAVKDITNKWGVEVRVFSHDSGRIIFKLNSEEDVQKVLQNGPYEGNFVYLMLRRMPIDFQFDEAGLSIVPVWIRLPSLPLKYWASDRLSLVASAIGEPIMMDYYTTNKERVSFARILVHVDTSRSLPDEIWIKNRFGGFKQRILYEFHPMYCTSCNSLGHLVSECRRSDDLPQSDQTPRNNRDFQFGKRKRNRNRGRKAILNPNNPRPNPQPKPNPGSKPNYTQAQKNPNPLVPPNPVNPNKPNSPAQPNSCHKPNNLNPNPPLSRPPNPIIITFLSPIPLNLPNIQTL